jgi:hypothetical protein
MYSSGLSGAQQLKEFSLRYASSSLRPVFTFQPEKNELFLPFNLLSTSGFSIKLKKLKNQSELPVRHCTNGLNNRVLCNFSTLFTSVIL